MENKYGSRKSPLRREERDSTSLNGPRFEDKCSLKWNSPPLPPPIGLGKAGNPGIEMHLLITMRWPLAYGSTSETIPGKQKNNKTWSLGSVVPFLPSSRQSDSDGGTSMKEKWVILMTFQSFSPHLLSKRKMFKNVYVTFLIINLKRCTADPLLLFLLCSHGPSKK